MTYGVFLDGYGEPYISDEAPPEPAEPTPRPAVVYVASPTPSDLARHLGWPPMDAEQELAAQSHLDRARAVVMGYTRGRGQYFTSDYLAEEIAAVILSLAGRSLANPTGDARIEAGAHKSSPGQPEFSLGDRLILDGWRRRAA